MKYYSRSQGQFIEGEPPAKSSIVNVNPITNLEGVEYAPEDSEGIVRNDTGLSSAYSRDQYQIDLQNDIETTGGKNAAKIKQMFDAYNPDESLRLQVEKTKQLEDLKLQTSAESAQKVLELLNKKDSGQISGDEYRAALEGLVSDYNSKRAFGEGGKNVTDIERQMLGGQLVNVNVIKPNVLQRAAGWATGSMPATTSKLGEDEATLRNKMIQAIIRAYPNADISEYRTTQAPTTETQGQIPQTGREKQQEFWTTSTGEKMNLSQGGLFENVGRNIIDIAKGLPTLGREVLRMTPAEGVIDMISGEKTDPLEGAKTAVNLGKGLLMSLAEVTGINENTVRIDEDGHFYWNPGQQVKDALIHDYNHPIDTVFWILPFIKGAKGKGIIEQAGKDAPSLEKVLVGQGEKALPKISSKAGKAATGVAVPIPESVVKSEELMSKALQNTKSNTIRGMATELEGSIATEGKVITQRATVLDGIIGPQPLDEIVNQVMSKVKETSSAKANPKLVNTIELDLRNQLSSGQLPGGLALGEVEGTTISNINKARMYMTSNLNSWFNNGQPVGTATNDLNAMRWASANGLKDIIGEADKEGIIRNSLDKQHVAFQTYPVLSKVALKGGAGVGSIGYKWGLIRKAWEVTAAPILERIRVSGARKLQGELPPIQPVEAPKTVSAPPGTPLSAVPTARPFALPEDIVTRTIGGKGAAQAERLVRDMRYKQGSWNPLKAQEELLRQASKKKYR